jgi:hypothetical protein
LPKEIGGGPHALPESRSPFAIGRKFQWTRIHFALVRKGNNSVPEGGLWSGCCPLWDLDIGVLARARPSLQWAWMYGALVAPWRPDTVGLVYFFGIFIPERCGDMRGFGVHSIPSNPLKYSFQKYSTFFR